jgi:Protein of unknown function (DUF4236)
MGFRFQRRLRLFKGVSLNIGKRGISSISLGTRGAHTTVGRSGIRNSIGLPGTGLSYSRLWPWKSRAAGNSASTPPTTTGSAGSLGAVVARMLGALTGYAVICVLAYGAWQYLQSPGASPALAPAASPTPINGNRSEPHDARMAHHDAHHPSHAASDTSSMTPPPPASHTAPSASRATSQSMPASPDPRTATTATDELLSVRAIDAAAAEHISTFCANVVASVVDRHDAIESMCRQREAAAWRRLNVDNEFASAALATIKKCGLPPFPDSYVGKEACLKYELNR